MRHRRQLHRKRTVAWPQSASPPGVLAATVTYIGSAEHKDHPSPAGAPRLRSDASRCDPRYATFDEPTRALRDAVRAQQTGEFVGAFPNYVWGVLDERLYEARLVNHELGQYKAYPVQVDELPDDPEGVLEGPIRAWRR